MLCRFRQLHQDEAGQTLVLASISLLVLTLVVMATVNIGNAIYERTQLQNAADSAAYSLAAMQARGMNFIAYTNRAQLVHYASMLTIQSYLSYMQYTYFVWVEILGNLASILFPPIAGFIQSFKRIAQRALELLDRILAYAMAGFAIFNFGMFGLQAAMVGIMLEQLAANPQAFNATDPDAKMSSSPLGVAAKFVNGLMYKKTFDWESIAKMLPLNRGLPRDLKVNGNEGRKVMADLINTTRHPWVAGTQEGLSIGQVLVGRTWDWGFSISVIPKIASLRVEIAKEARTEHGMRTESADKYDQNFAEDGFRVFGSARVATIEVRVGFTLASQVWADHIPWRGGHWITLYGVDGHDTPIRCINHDPVVSALACKAVNTFINGTVRPVWIAARMALESYVATMFRHGRPGQHPYLGATPFVKFSPKNKWRQAFNQLDYMVVATKETAEVDRIFARQQREFGINLRGDIGSGRTDFSFDQSPLGFLGPGMSAVSVARVYYHRPGDWREHPNLFNPFWGARLQPVAHHQLPELTRLNRILPSGFKPEEIIVH